MNIQDAYIRVIEFLRQHDSFSIDENLREVLLEGESIERSKQVFELALKRLEKPEIVIRGNGGDAWFLVRPFDALPQNVVLSGETAATVARIVNRACELADDKASGADPLNITEADILKLCSILGNVAEQLHGEQVNEVIEQQRVPLGFAA